MNETYRDLLSAAIILAVVAYPLAKAVNFATEVAQIL